MATAEFSKLAGLLSTTLSQHHLSGPWDFPGQNTGVGSPSLLQGIFPFQGSNLGLLHYRWILYQVSHQGNHAGRGWYFKNKTNKDPAQGPCCCCCLVSKSCLTLCNLVDYSLPVSSVCGISQARVLERKWSCSVLSDSLWSHGMYLAASSVHGIFQAIVLEWIAISFSRGSFRPRDWTRVSFIAGGFFKAWATREAHTKNSPQLILWILLSKCNKLLLCIFWGHFVRYMQF